MRLKLSRSGGGWAEAGVVGVVEVGHWDSIVSVEKNEKAKLSKAWNKRRWMGEEKPSLRPSVAYIQLGRRRWPGSGFVKYTLLGRELSYPLSIKFLDCGVCMA